MILAASDFDIYIHYQKELEPLTDDPTDPPVFHYYEVHSLNITNKLIPEVLFIDKIGTEKNFLYTIYLLHNIRIETRDENLASKLLRIFATDFENTVLQDDYPELFL